MIGNGLVFNAQGLAIDGVIDNDDTTDSSTSITTTLTIAKVSY